MGEFRDFMQDRLKLRFIAKTDKEQRLGLMGQPPLLPNEGALFVYSSPSSLRFWNRNVDFPIDVGFFGPDKQLLSVGQLDAHQEEGIEHFGQFALETSRGFFSGIKKGTHLDELAEL